MFRSKICVKAVKNGKFGILNQNIYHFQRQKKMTKRLDSKRALMYENATFIC